MYCNVFHPSQEDIEMGAVGGGNADLGLRTSIDTFSRAHMQRHMEALHLNDLRSLFQGFTPPATSASGLLLIY